MLSIIKNETRGLNPGLSAQVHLVLAALLVPAAIAGGGALPGILIYGHPLTKYTKSAHNSSLSKRLQFHQDEAQSTCAGVVLGRRCIRILYGDWNLRNWNSIQMTESVV